MTQQRIGRLEGKVAIIVGAGQSPGETIGNGRATAIRFAEEGAKVLLVDRRLASAEETGVMISARRRCSAPSTPCCIDRPQTPSPSTAARCNAC